MARSNQIWLIQFEDDSIIYVEARELSQIIYHEKILEYDIDTIIKIEAIELSYSWSREDYPDLISLCSDD